jgi:hypothetical protein
MILNRAERSDEQSEERSRLRHLRMRLAAQRQVQVSVPLGSALPPRTSLTP